MVLRLSIRTMDLITKGREHNNMNEMGAIDIDIDIDIDNLNEINFFFSKKNKKSYLTVMTKNQ